MNDQYLEHAGVKGMKWGVRNPDLKAALKNERSNIRSERRVTADKYNSNLKTGKVVGQVIGASLLKGPIGGASAVAGYHMSRKNFTKGQSIAIGLIGGAPGALLMNELSVRREAKSRVGQ